MSSHAQAPVPIAIIGMGCHYPADVNSAEDLWDTVSHGKSGWSEVPADRFNHSAFYHPDPEAPGAVNQKGGHFLNRDIAAFDAGFFGVPRPEAETMDPQQRVVLETAWEAVENAGIPMPRFKGSNTGIFVAMFGHDFDHVLQKDPVSLSKNHNLGVARPLLANRLSYVFDLQGPSVMIDTACSGSLVAVNSACQSLRSGESSMALAGGVGLIFSPDQMALMSMTGIFNDEGRSYTFDDRGNGYGRGEGVGMVALKRLDDAIRDGDNIRAVIRNSGANSDGRTTGIMLPSQAAQGRLAQSLFRNLSFTPLDVQYAEAHGTGTKAGDEVEIGAIRDVFCHDRRSGNPIFVGATKPNIGHSEAASGVAGLIKTVMAMEKGMIPPNILLENFKPGLKPDEQTLKVSKSLTPWPYTGSSRKAVVNSFGFGGTNAMVVLESAETYGLSENPKVNGDENASSEGKLVVDDSGESRPRLFTLSATSEHSLQQAAAHLHSYLERHGETKLDDLSYTLASRRSRFQWRSSIVARSIESLKEALSAQSPGRIQKPPQLANVFVFTGQGAQSARMGYHLLQSHGNEFARSISRSEKALRSLGADWSLIEELSRDQDTSRLHDSKYGQPASTAVQLALVDLLKSWNIRPSMVVGHSSGEIAAAYASGALSHRAAMLVSYHRGFLANMSRERSSQPGAMLAVGLGDREIEKYLAVLDKSGAVVACINSPSSITVSGDADTISQLKTALDADGVFARQLKVDTAYHSHHMESVSSDYLSLLQGLESGTVDPSVRYFSTVTGDQKTGNFDASYWVNNLVSPVQFSTALQSICQDQIHTALNIIEIGPHQALAGPVRQTLTSLQAEAPQYTYIPTLIRGENSIESLINTGANIFRSGVDFDAGAVASLAISDSSPSFLKDLPPYPWNHTTTHWIESRLSREHRFRKHSHHDLLGSRVAASPDSQPSWRLMLSIDTLPWLKDHMIDGFIVFPGAAYMTMAIQALKQIDDDRRPDVSPRGYRLRNVSFKKTLTLPRDGKSVETILAFQYSETTEAWLFTVSSMSDQNKWQEHCDGAISAVYSESAEADQGQREDELFQASKLSHLRSASDACESVITHDKLYEQMAATGNQYGPTFAINIESRMSEYRSLNKLVIADIQGNMPGKYMQPHIIHPTTLDAIIQACLPVYQQHSVRGSVMPILMADVFVSTDIVTEPGTELQTLCDLCDTFPHSTGFNTTGFQKDKNGNTKCVLTIDGGEIRVVGESQSVSQDKSSTSAFKVEWGLDRSSITPELLESVDVPLQSTEAGITQAEKVDLGSMACARYIDWAVREMRDRNLAVKNDHRINWWRLLQEFYDSRTGQELIQRSPKTKDELDKLTSRIGVEGEAIAKIGPELVPLLTGQTDPLTHFLEDDLIFRVYHSDEGARPNRYMAEYAKLLTFQRRDLRILEIGAGTGGTTYQVLQACSPSGEDFCAEYMYTDISSGFFEAVRTTRLKPWAHLLAFQTLDLEKDAAEQGFEEHAYDLVIAANVVHATRSLHKSLCTIRKLLKPGGLLGLVELTRTTPYINMTFGSIPGWWAGVDEGRTDSPLQSADQWNGHLQRAGFSGVDIAAYDLPEPERHCALLTATAVTSIPLSNIASPQARLLEFLPEGLKAHDPSNKVASELVNKGFQLASEDWSESSVDSVSSYIIFDSSERPLLRHASAEQFSRLTSLLSKAAKVYWISFGSNNELTRPDNAMAVGVSRTARNENPSIQCFTVDVQDSFAQHVTDISQTLAGFIASTEDRMTNGEFREFELLYRNGKLQIQRLVAEQRLKTAISASPDQVETEDTILHQEGRSLRISVSKPGLLNTLAFVDDERGNIGADEVEIKSYAWGINFSDVFIALGQLPATQPMVGESSGIITAVGSNFTATYKPGDRVAAMFGTPYASRTRTNGHLVHKIPDSLSFTDAASITLTFATAYYSLFDCANLQKGQTILIHSASGALGQVAIKIAQRLGALIFATVSSSSKRQLLIEQYGIPESHIFSSRTTDFAQGVKRLTNGLGADVVLNSLSGPMLHASWECVAPFGNFVEVGKADIYRRSQLSMKPFENNLRFSSVDLVKLSQQRPEYCQRLLQKIFADLAAEFYTPLSVTKMPIGDIEKAFRLMQSRKHTGKIVLEATDDSTVLAKVQPLQLRPDGTYIIVGGLGGMGKLICRHLQVKGARHIALFSRQQLGDSKKDEVEKSLTEVSEAVVKVVTCDVGDSDMVKRVAKDLSDMMPPVRGIIHGGMVLSDHTISKITKKDFEIALRPKYQGTLNVCDAFYHTNLDFFINLSSLCGIVGTLGQSNYAAGGTYQDMFTHAQVSAGRNNFITIDLPLIKSTYSVTQEHTQSLKRQGIQLLPIEDALPVLDYVMSGKAFKDGNHQIAFGLEIQAFIDQAKHGGRIPPLLSHVTSDRGRGLSNHADQQKEQTHEENIALATSVDEVESLTFLAVRDKIASLTALDTQELDLNPPIANLALDSLVATEIKNWITNTLRAPVQISDIMDAQSIRSLASFVASVSTLVKVKTQPVNGTDANRVSEEERHDAEHDNDDKKMIHPKYPLRSLEATLEHFFDSVGHLGTAEELQRTRKAITEFTTPDGFGQQLQERLTKHSGELGENDEVVDMYVRNKWLRGRDWRPRLRNFFATLPRQDVDRRPQADQAALLSLAAYKYKKSVDDGTVKQDIYNEQALDMATIHWLFGSNRTPALGCDRVESFPESDYFVAMNRGHMYKVGLETAKATTADFESLRSTFLQILQETPRETSYVSVLTSADRDEWAKARDDIIKLSQRNNDFVKTVEECLFIINLEEATPETASERADVFLLDDNSNRWLDKTLSFIVCANGVSSIWGEHTMVDGTTFDGLIKAISSATVEPTRAFEAPTASSATSKSDFTYLPITLPPSMPEYIKTLQVQHRTAHEGYTLANLRHTSYAAAYLRKHKLPPKSIIQLVVQIAVRRILGHNPLGAVDVVSQRPFRGGRTDMIYVMTDPVQAFCAAAEDPSVDAARKRKLLLEAVKSHARLMAMSTQGWGFRWHLMALKEMLEPGEKAPGFYEDDVFVRTSQRPICTSFTEFGLPEMGRCQPHKADIWIGVQVLEERVQFTVINGERKSEEFVQHLKVAAEVMKTIIEANVDR